MLAGRREGEGSKECWFLIVPLLACSFVFSSFVSDT